MTGHGAVGVFEVVDARRSAHVNGFALAQSGPLSTGLSMAGCGVVEVFVVAAGLGLTVETAVERDVAAPYSQLAGLCVIVFGLLVVAVQMTVAQSVCSFCYCRLAACSLACSSVDWRTCRLCSGPS